MTYLVRHPGLTLLARLKLRAWLRSLRRRLSTPSGIVFGGIGLLLLGLWLASLLFRGKFAGASGIELDAELRDALVAGSLAFFALIVIIGSLSHRGLYLPKDEIERLLSAPVTRADLVRYRLIANVGRSFFFAIITGILVAPRMPRPTLAFLGTAVAMLTLPMLGQASALVFGDAENRLGRVSRRIPALGLRLVALFGFWLLVMLFVMSGDLFDHDAGGMLGRDGMLMSFLNHPVARAVAIPFTPWARSITAESVAGFVPWFAASLAILAVSFEATARIPVDFRLLTLETSADVARRLSRMRSGGNLISGAKVSKRALGWRIPWVFGRGPFGAIAWLKLCAIMRKSRGTLMFSIAVLAFATVAGVTLFKDPVGGAVFIALLATFYLGSGLRFDFRADLDLMEVIKSWPVAPWRIFLATLLPEVTIISLMIAVSIVTRSLLLSQFDVEIWYVLGCSPFACLLWLAVDNAVFLLVPVRFVPGQGSAMHHAGRTMVLVFLRMAIFTVILLLAGAVAFLASVATADWLGLGPEISLLLTALSAGAVGVAGLIGTILFGAWALERFDVARERSLTG